MEAKTGRDSYVVGLKQVRRALRDGIAGTVLLAEDADPMILEPLLRACEQAGVPYERVRSMRELGRLCGINVGAAAAAQVR